MQLEAKQIEQKPKKVGTLRGAPVFHLRTKGGLHILVTKKGAGYETLATGPHKAVARHIANKHEPEIFWSEMSKSDHVEVYQFEHLLPRYEEITEFIRKSE